MKTLIIDDEVKSGETLKTLITNYCEGISVAGVASTFTDARELIRSAKPELVFLDISMPEGTGFELLKSLPSIDFEVIFVTAFDAYGIEAIKANALDYLLKPVNVEELKSAIAKAGKKLQHKQTIDLSALIHQLNKRPNGRGKIAIPASDGLIFLSLDDIITLSADGSYTTIPLREGKKVLSTRNLGEYESILSGEDFIRVHHSHIVNLHHVKHYHRGEGGSVTMSDGSEVLISKRKKKDFLDKFSM